MEHMRKQIAQAPTPEELVSRRKPPKPKPAPKPPKQRAPTHYTLGDETLTVEQWAERAGIAPATIQSRLSKGWPLAKALTSRRGQHLSPARTWRRGLPPVTITHAGMTLTIQQWADRTGLTVDRIVPPRQGLADRACAYRHRPAPQDHQARRRGSMTNLPTFALSAAISECCWLATSRQPSVAINIHPTSTAIATIGTHEGSDQPTHPAPEAGGSGVVIDFAPVQPNRRHEARTKLPVNNVSEVTSYE